MFKKKSLKFTNEKVSRDLRHAEAFKARENSRFKRLSIIRSLNDSDFVENMETTKENKAPETQIVKTKPSRLEMLFKWKQEKKLKAELEKNSKKKPPFYAGSNKNLIENKASQSFKTNSSFNTSKFSKSKLVTPSTIVQTSRIQNSRQGTPSSAIQSSKVKQIASTSTFQLSKNVISKQFTPGASQASKLPHPKQTTLPKPGTNLSRSNSTATLSRKFPASAADKISTLAKPAVGLTRSNSTAAIPRKFPVLSSQIDKAVSSKATAQKVPTLIKRTPFVPISGNTIKSKDVSKPLNKGLLESRNLPKRQEEKYIKKAGTESKATAVSKGNPVQCKIGTGLPKPTSNSTTVSKGNSNLGKMLSNVTKKFGLNPKFNQKEASQEANISSRKGYCFRTAFENSSRQKANVSLKTPVQGTPKKLPEKIAKNTQEKPSIKEFHEQSLDGIPDVTFNSDISIIKPPRTSFAPTNFTFAPPEGLNNFVFDDDGYDVFQDLEEVKLKFMSRTSTPSKNSSGRNSSIKNSKESLENSIPVADVEKTPDLSNSDDIRISELMTPSTSEVEIVNKEVDELVNKQTCNEVTCDIITNIEIKNTNIEENQQTNAKETNIDLKQETCEGLASDKTAKQQTNQEISSDINTDLNQETPKELAFVSQVKVVVTTDSTETAVENVDGAVQKCLFSEKESFDDSDITENPKTDTAEKSSNEKHFNLSVKNETPERLAEGIGFLDDDSLLDSIDVNQMMIKSDDEDGDEDDVPSPLILKCTDRKSNGAFPKRISMLKRLSVMNSIAETNEADINQSKSSDSQETESTPRRSKRVSNLASVDTLSYSPMKSGAGSPNTPRRSLRLIKVSNGSDNYPVSPFQEKNTNVSSRRRSVRLIDLNTPEKAACEKLLGENFENLDPNNFLIDLESPTLPALPKSKKVSLLYSPERRKSIRKSIKGDLMSFSPV